MSLFFKFHANFFSRAIFSKISRYIPNISRHIEYIAIYSKCWKYCNFLVAIYRQGEWLMIYRDIADISPIYVTMSRTSSGSLLYTSLVLRIFHSHPTTPPCLECSASYPSPESQNRHNFNEFLFSVRNKSSTYNNSITGISPSTLK